MRSLTLRRSTTFMAVVLALLISLPLLAYVRAQVDSPGT